MTMAVSLTSGSSGSAPIRSASAAPTVAVKRPELEVRGRPKGRRALGHLAEAPEQAQDVALVESCPIDRAGRRRQGAPGRPRRAARPRCRTASASAAAVGLVPVEEHRLLGREVVEHRLLGHLAGRGDAGDADVVEALGEEHARSPRWRSAGAGDASCGRADPRPAAARSSRVRRLEDREDRLDAEVGSSVRHRASV